ncbi:MAG: DUF5680 domain-containing protein [Nanoarchaeota archaeon]|nr:DUF5680 domain-containing protein [Nanoarchaeota archaeon]
MIVNEKVKLGKLEVNLDRLAEFIADAKKSCYAGNGKKDRAEDGSKVLTFQGEDFHYTDNYDGFYQAPGSEIVRWKKKDGQRIWQMSYSGGMLPIYEGDEKLAKSTFKFLKEVLSQVTPERPFRGPAGAEDSRFSYSDILFGNSSLKRFSGREEIRDYQVDEKDPRFCKLVFSQDYIGGLIIP